MIISCYRNNTFENFNKFYVIGIKAIALLINPEIFTLFSSQFKIAKRLRFSIKDTFDFSKVPVYRNDNIVRFKFISASLLPSLEVH